MPSAVAENALLRPSAASPRCRLNSTNSPGVGITLTPPTRAIAHSPFRSACTARWRLTSEEEQAVSTLTAGPSRPKVYATRPEPTLLALPVPR
ncbi:hypothetical protein SFUMM280S_00111 [Streptomyces fumanus]